MGLIDTGDARAACSQPLALPLKVTVPNRLPLESHRCPLWTAESPVLRKKRRSLTVPAVADVNWVPSS